MSFFIFFCLHCCCCENKIRSGQHGGANVFSRNCFVQPTWNVGDDECHVHHGRTGYGSSVQRSSQYRLWWMEVGCVSPAQHFCPPNQIIYQESAVTIWTTTQKKVFFALRVLTPRRVVVSSYWFLLSPRQLGRSAKGREEEKALGGKKGKSLALCMNVVQPQPVIDSLAAFHHYGTFWLESKRKTSLSFSLLCCKKRKEKLTGQIKGYGRERRNVFINKKWEELRDVNSIRRALSEWWTLLLKEERNIKWDSEGGEEDFDVIDQ